MLGVYNSHLNFSNSINKNLVVCYNVHKKPLYLSYIKSPQLKLTLQCASSDLSRYGLLNPLFANYTRLFFIGGKSFYIYVLKLCLRLKLFNKVKLNYSDLVYFQSYFVKLLKLNNLSELDHFESLYSELYLGGFQPITALFSGISKYDLLSVGSYDMVLKNDVPWYKKNLDFDDYFFKLINKFVSNGKKTVAMKLASTLLHLHKLHNLANNHSYILGDVFDSISPKFRMVNIKFQGRNQSVPKLINSNKIILYGIKTFLQSVKARKDSGILLKSFNELLDIYNLKGSSFKLKESNYKAGISNRYMLFRRSTNWRSRKIRSLKKNYYFLG